MDSRKSRQLAFLGGMLVMLAAWSVNWLISSGARDPSTMRVIAVVLQGVVAAAVAAWCWRRSARVTG